MSYRDFIKRKVLAEGGIYDPKQRTHYQPQPPSPEDDDYEPGEDYDDGDNWDQGPDHLYPGQPQALQYPKAKVGSSAGRLRPGKTPGPGRGMSIKTPDQMFGADDTHDNLSDDDLYKTLQAKLQAGEAMTADEKLWLSLLARKSIRHTLKHGPLTQTPLSDDPLD